MENQRKNEENEMQLKQDASSRMQEQWNSNRRPLCISQTHCQKLCEISQCENFAIPNSQCENFAMPISQCQIQIRNAKFKFAMPISISQCQYTVHLSQPMRNFALRNSQPTLRISQTHFALRNSPCEICRPCHPL